MAQHERGCQWHKTPRDTLESQCRLSLTLLEQLRPGVDAQQEVKTKKIFVSGLQGLLRAQIVRKRDQVRRLG